MRRYLRRKALRSITSPLAIPNCEIWLRADLGITTGGIGVTDWVNQGTVGSAGNAVQHSSSAYEPRYHASGGLNNQAYLQFDGPAGMNWAYTTAPGAKTIIIVLQMTSLPTTGQTVYEIFDSAVTTHSSEMVLDLATYQMVSFVDDWVSGGTMFGHNDTLGTGAGHILLHTYDGSGQTAGDYTASFDGVTKTVVASGAYGSVNIGSAIGLRADGSFQLNAKVAEIIMIARKCSGAEQAQLVSYLQTRYAL